MTAPNESRPQYVLGHEQNEMKRLQSQHEWLKAGMKGELIQAPLDRTCEEMAVLDSGTADGKTYLGPSCMRKLWLSSFIQRATGSRMLRILCQQARNT